MNNKLEKYMIDNNMIDVRYYAYIELKNVDNNKILYRKIIFPCELSHKLTLTLDYANHQLETIKHFIMQEGNNGLIKLKDNQYITLGVMKVYCEPTTEISFSRQKVIAREKITTLSSTDITIEKLESFKNIYGKDFEKISKQLLGNINEEEEE